LLTFEKQEVYKAKAARGGKLATAYAEITTLTQRVTDAASPAGIESYLGSFNARDQSSIRKSAVYKTIVSRVASLKELFDCAEEERDEARAARDGPARLLGQVVQRFCHSVPLHEIDGMSSWLRL
jgi:hypothetical protein